MDSETAGLSDCSATDSSQGGQAVPVITVVSDTCSFVQSPNKRLLF